MIPCRFTLCPNHIYQNHRSNLCFYHLKIALGLIDTQITLLKANNTETLIELEGLAYPFSYYGSPLSQLERIKNNLQHWFPNTFYESWEPSSYDYKII